MAWGLCGNISFLLDMYSAFGDEKYLREALELATAMEAFSEERGVLLLWRSDDGSGPEPSLMTGYAGIASTLLRLSNADRIPGPLSREAFATAPFSKVALKTET
jgi:lantibiotic modifying enzyme